MRAFSSALVLIFTLSLFLASIAYADDLEEANWFWCTDYVKLRPGRERIANVGVHLPECDAKNQVIITEEPLTNLTPNCWMEEEGRRYYLYLEKKREDKLTPNSLQIANGLYCGSALLNMERVGWVLGY